MRKELKMGKWQRVICKEKIENGAKGKMRRKRVKNEKRN
jgi:hypothetical protein